MKQINGSTRPAYLLLAAIIFGVLPARGEASNADPTDGCNKDVPEATSFVMPLNADLDPNQASHSVRQAVGDYNSALATQKDKNGVVVKVSTHSFCGQHLAEDIRATPNDDVLAIADGIVVYSNPVDGLGHAIRILHKLPDGSYITSVYYHNKRPDAGGVATLKTCDIVHAGDVIGHPTSVAKDNFGAQHLHFGIRHETDLPLGYKGNRIDSRTSMPFYGGYTSRRTTVGGKTLRNCDLPGKSVETDKLDRTHLSITRDWEPSPLAFVQARMDPAAAEIVFQPGPDTRYGRDIWTTSVFSYTGTGGGPGGGLNDDVIRIGGWGDLYYGLIKFDLDSLPIVAGSARIELFMPKVTGAGTTKLYLDRILYPWDWRFLPGKTDGRDDKRLWWDDLPASIPLSPNQLTAPTPGQWYSIDITQLYNDWQDGTYPNEGIMLRPVGAGNNTWVEFVSSGRVPADNRDFVNPAQSDRISYRPKLVVTPGTLPPPQAFVTFTASGQINNIANGGGALGEWFPVVPTVGDYFTVEYTFDTSTTDSEPAPGSATYLGSISEISLIVGSNPPVTISAQNLTTNRTKITAAGSPCFYEILVGGLGATGRDFSYSFNLSGGPTGCMPETLPTEPPYVPTFSSAPFGFGAVNRAGGLDNIGGAISEITQNLGQL